VVVVEEEKEPNVEVVSEEAVQRGGDDLFLRKEQGPSPTIEEGTGSGDIVAAEDIGTVVVVVEQDEEEPLFVGDTVDVEHDYSPCVNIVGGTGRITKINDNGTFNVLYFVGGGDKNIRRELLSKKDLFQKDSTRKSRSDQDPGRGRCGNCNSFLRDCTCANSVKIAKRKAPTTEEMAVKSAHADALIRRMQRRKDKHRRRNQQLDSSSSEGGGGGGDSSNSDFGGNASDLDFGPEVMEESDDDDFIAPSYVFRVDKGKDRSRNSHSKNSGRIVGKGGHEEEDDHRKTYGEPTGRILDDETKQPKRHKPSGASEQASRKRKRKSQKDGSSSKPCWLTIDGIPSECEHDAIRAMFSATLAANILRIKRRQYYGVPHPTVAVSFRNKFVAQKALAECNGMQCGDGWLEAALVFKLEKASSSSSRDDDSRRKRSRRQKIKVMLVRVLATTF
jgi:hypothetical protein